MSTPEAETSSDAAQRSTGRRGLARVRRRVLIGSLRMDRLESQGINPYTPPASCRVCSASPSYLFGGVAGPARLAAEGCAKRARTSARTPAAAPLALVLALCLVFGIGLVGHGLPFWAAASLFVAILHPGAASADRPTRERGDCVHGMASRRSSRLDWPVGAAAGVGMHPCCLPISSFLCRICP